MREYVCKKCESQCKIDGEYPKFFSWCYACNNYTAGFDGQDYAIDVLTSMIDQTTDKVKEHGLRLVSMTK